MTEETAIGRLPGSQSMLDAARWVVDSGLEDRPIADMLAGLADRLLEAGIPVTRIQIAFRLLHPRSISSWRPGLARLGLS